MFILVLCTILVYQYSDRQVQDIRYPKDQTHPIKKGGVGELIPKKIL